MVERVGNVKAKHVKSSGASVLLPQIQENISHDAKIYSDTWGSYKSLNCRGYNHASVNHLKSEWKRDAVHTNTIECFWSQMKRSINGTYHVVSPKYLQLYVNEFSFRYNHRHLDYPVFQQLIARV